MAGDLDSAIDTLKDILSGPDASEKISSLLGAFGQDLPFEKKQEDKKDEQNGELFDSLPIESMMKIAKAYSGLNSEKDPRVTLLKAIKPYVRSGRAESVDTAIKMLGLIKLAPLLGDLKDVL